MEKLETVQMSINWWMAKQIMVYSHIGVSSSRWNDEALTHDTTWMNIKNIMLSERSQTKGHRVYDSTYSWSSVFMVVILNKGTENTELAHTELLFLWEKWAPGHNMFVN